MTNAEDDIVVMELPDLGLQISKWISYSANSHFTTPTDGFEFLLSADDTPANVRDALRAGARSRISVNGQPQAEGYVDRVTTQASRSAGTQIRVEGSDALAQVVRSGIDPRTRFADNMTLLDVLIRVFEPFGYTIDDFLVDNDTNRNIRTGAILGPKTTLHHSKKKGTTVKPLKSYVLHQTKPYPGEGAFAFASRLAQRFGLWIWLSAVGGIVIVGKPTFDQPARYTIVNGEGTASTVLDGSAREDSSNQPSIIVATGFSYSGDADRSALKVVLLNELVASDADGTLQSALDIVSANKDAKVVPVRGVFSINALRRHPSVQPIYLHDQESQTLEQLENYARRELAMRQKDSLHVHYVVEGHENNGVIWCVDTIVDVQDDLLGIHEPLWVLSRTFEKSRDSGTRTILELIRPHTFAV